jgi:2,3-dihydroxy-p-cumate/2,3-dihydroxybenzoate 3,4-dioxygenase
LIAIEQLRYVRLGTTDLAGAADFAQRMLGLEPIDRTETLATFRSDFRDHTLAFVAGEPAMQAVGFEVRDATTLADARDALLARGLRAEFGTAEECAARKVRELLWFFDHSGNRIELVVRPLNSGWRYFPSQDRGVKGLADVMLRSTAIAEDEALWTQLLGARVSDWAGNAAYLQIDAAHHRLALFPSTRAGVLAVEYTVEDVNLLMRNYYALQAAQVPIVHGPGRRPASEQLFLTFTGPDGVLFSFVAEGRTADETNRRPRQFPAGRAGLCGWGSDSSVEEFNRVDGKRASAADTVRRRTA